MKINVFKSSTAEWKVPARGSDRRPRFRMKAAGWGRTSESSKRAAQKFDDAIYQLTGVKGIANDFLFSSFYDGKLFKSTGGHGMYAYVADTENPRGPTFVLIFMKGNADYDISKVKAGSTPSFNSTVIERGSEESRKWDDVIDDLLTQHADSSWEGNMRSGVINALRDQSPDFDSATPEEKEAVLNYVKKIYKNL